MEMHREKNIQKKKIKCLDCRITMEKTILKKDNLSFEGYQCLKCGNTVLTMEQLKKYNTLRDLKNTIPEKRKIVKIGNSFGITFPSILKDYGMKTGKDVEIRILSPHNLEIKFCW